MKTFEIARQAFVVALEERISGYTLRICDAVKRDPNSLDCQALRDSRDYWIGILKCTLDGEKIARDSQPGDLFARVYQQMRLPAGEYEVVSARILKGDMR